MPKRKRPTKSRHGPYQKRAHYSVPAGTPTALEIYRLADDLATRVVTPDRTAWLESALDASALACRDPTNRDALLYMAALDVVRMRNLALGPPRGLLPNHAIRGVRALLDRGPQQIRTGAARCVGCCGGRGHKYQWMGCSGDWCAPCIVAMRECKLPDGDPNSLPQDVSANKLHTPEPKYVSSTESTPSPPAPPPALPTFPAPQDREITELVLKWDRIDRRLPDVTRLDDEAMKARLFEDVAHFSLTVKEVANAPTVDPLLGGALHLYWDRVEYYRGLQKVFVPHALHVARTASRP